MLDLHSHGLCLGVFARLGCPAPCSGVSVRSYVEEQSSSYGAGCAETPFCCCSAPSRVGAAPFYYRHNPCWGCSPLLTCLSLLRGGCAGALSCRQSCTGEGGSMQPPPLPNRQDLCNGANVTGKAQLQLRCTTPMCILPWLLCVVGGAWGSPAGGQAGCSHRLQQLQPLGAELSR